MMDAIGREPVYLVDGEPQALDRPVADIFEGELVRVRALVTDQANKASSPLGIGEKRNEVAAFERYVRLAVGGGAARLDVGHVESLVIGAALKPDSELVPHR
ncbi:hypothetical protein D9M70_581800 [compost metagenome]